MESGEKYMMLMKSLKSHIERLIEFQEVNVLLNKSNHIKSITVITDIGERNIKLRDYNDSTYVNNIICDNMNESYENIKKTINQINQHYRSINGFDSDLI